MREEVRSEIERIADAFDRELGPAVASASLAGLGLKLIGYAENPKVSGFIGPHVFIRRAEFTPASHHAISISMILAKRVLGR